MDGQDVPKGDKLILRGLKFHGFHGVKAEEKKLGQKFLVDVDAWLDLSDAGKTDCLTDTVSYTDIYREDSQMTVFALAMVSTQLDVDDVGCFFSLGLDIFKGKMVERMASGIAQDVVEGPSQNLLESVAQLIANSTLRKFPQISAVRVKVGKPHVAVHGPVDYLGVEILRCREVKTSSTGTSFMI